MDKVFVLMGQLENDAQYSRSYKIIGVFLSDWEAKQLKDSLPANMYFNPRIFELTVNRIIY